MAMVVTLRHDGPGPSVLVSEEELVQEAEKVGVRFTDGNEPRGLASPGLEIQVNAEQDEQEDKARFTKGTIELSLHLKIFLLNTMTECETRAWREHEMFHIGDAKTIANQLKQSLIRQAMASNSVWKRIFVDKKWVDLSDFNAQRDSLANRIAEIYGEKFAEATSRRDTPAEYRRVEESIRKRCTEGSGNRRTTGSRPRTTGREAQPPRLH